MRLEKQQHKIIDIFFFNIQKTRQRLIFKINSKVYEKDKYSFQNDNFMIDINNVDIEK